MPRKPPVHTVDHGEGWENRREGAKRVPNTLPGHTALERRVNTTA